MIRRMDLLPVAYAARRRDRRNTSLVILAGSIVLLLLVVWYFVLRGQVASAEDELALVRQQNTVLEGQIAELQEFAALDAEVKNKRTALQTVFAGDIDWPSIMTEIAMVIPGEIWLDSLEGSAGTTEGSTPVATETNPIRLTKKAAVGRLTFGGNSVSCMPGVAKWLVRLATVEEFDAAWIGSATEGDTRPGCEPPVLFDSTLELNERALSHRFEGELQ
jgi:Tfp pilus assembly protein PilN